MTKALLLGAFALALGTFAFRFAGPVLRNRVKVSPRAVRLMEIASVVLLTALVVTTLVPSQHSPVGIALPAGVLVAAVLAWRRAPILLVLFAAAVTTAGLRYFGLS
ncbi:AzlD domain-containing protein [Nocardia yamanashiensis]|uniref:AzlD domain-containing protein n=1 Tax=Nocardia yamanashiensis TaxID=209247 RepID=UPI0008331132|nr:AzlD domain-containing protein [Nocardia yamanashiensis]